jgi:hypothetical protein
VFLRLRLAKEAGECYNSSNSQADLEAHCPKTAAEFDRITNATSAVPNFGTSLGTLANWLGKLNKCKFADDQL